ncbi:MAG TPA: PDZ domain-containing protein [Gemmatimonadaceae bacterium]
MRRMVVDSAALNRATLGVTLNQTGSRRDTLGIFISAVVENGPAERAGIYEGDRIAAINGVDVRTSATDAGDSYLAGVAHRRLTLEMRKLTAGQRVNLRVWSGGRYKDVQVTTARYADVYRNRGRTISIGSGDMWAPGLERTIRIAPRIRNRTLMRTPRVAPMHFDGAHIELDAMGHALAESKVALEKVRAGAMEQARKALSDAEVELLELEPMIIDMEHLFDSDNHLIEPLDDVLLETMESGDQVSDDQLDANDAGELAREAVRQAEATLRSIGEIEVADSGSI